MNLTPDMMATGLILLSAMLNASSASIFKADGDRLVRSTFGSMLSLSIMLPISFFVPFPEPHIWKWLLLSTVGIFAFQLTFLKAISMGEFNYCYPISRGLGPVFLVILSMLFLSHDLTGFELFGVFLVAFGIFLLSLRGAQETLENKSILGATGYSILVGLLIAAYTTVDAIGIKGTEHPFSYIVWLFICVAILMISYTFSRRGKAVLAAVKAERKRGFFGSFLGLSSYATALMALRVGDMVEIAALRETSIMFALLIGYFFLGEGIGIRRILAIVIISIGAVTIKAF